MGVRKFKRVGILVLEGCTPMAPVAAMEILNKAGRIHQQLKKTERPFFETELIGLRSKRVRASDRFALNCHKILNEVSTTDLLLIPAMEFDLEEKLKQNQSAIPHLLRLRKKGAEIGSLCTGAFLLASSGLLKNKSATTHWYAAAKFRKMFPDTKLEDHKIIVDEDGLYTSGGATSSMHLGLYLTEKYCGKETANEASRMLLLDNFQTLQTRFSIFIPQTRHNDHSIHEAQKFIEEEHAEKVSVDTLSRFVHLSRRNFIRRFKTATGNTPLEYIQRMNVEKAKRQLENSELTVEEIIYSLGYNDIHSFRKIFNRYTDLTPQQYRVKYGFKTA